MVTTLTGMGIGTGIAAGVVVRMPEPLVAPPDVESDSDAAEELARVRDALAATAAELTEKASRAEESARRVLEAQALMAEDPAVLDTVRARVESGATGERAVFDAFGAFQAALEGMGGYLAGRAADLRDVSQRTIARLRGVRPPGIPEADTPFVLVAHDLAPADTVGLDPDKVLAIVTSDGSATSHTAILARARAVPAVVGVGGCDALRDGALVLVDAERGEVVSDPAEGDLARLRPAGEEAPESGTAPGRLADGTPVPLLANLGRPEQAPVALALGAEGVGLLRTEFLFLDAHAAPSVAEQRDRYCSLLEAFASSRVVVRVLDAGADKGLRFLGHAQEANPALGTRGLRALREHEHVLRDQLDALAQARERTGAQLWVMAPMVADVDEAEYFVGLGRAAGADRVGVTIEVPAAALLADRIAPLCDFLSIGTNDLTQYTMAADRMLAATARYQDPCHPAVLRLVQHVGDAGARAGIPVAVCGEAAADPLAAAIFVGLGVTELSMSPSALADVRRQLAVTTRADATRAARAALAARDAASARAAARAALLAVAGD